jgi:sarcosine oxidase subunit alpha|uniref:(2Fe-2S)-binding protein n=1 Tax=candidate division WOR-3 bacterium TaxID=2052148 RepID=A0A7V3UZI3_UNCW3
MPKRTSENKNLRISEHPILSFNRGQKVTFYFEGKPMQGYLGETIAAALVANGVKVFRYTEKHKRARGFFCAVGKCSSCLMVVDGIPNTMVCMEPLRAGVRVERQRGRGKLKTGDL